MRPGLPIAIVGLGLIGGSLARALAAQGAHILGFDGNAESLRSAMREGAVHEELDAKLSDVSRAEVILLAVPVSATVRAVEAIAPHAGNARLIMDVASTKATIVAAAESAGIGDRYIGAHPLTGSHRSGWGASRASLFRDSRVFLCPASSTTPGTRELANSFWRMLGAGTELLDADQHDREMAWRSHLPHLLSTALAVTLHHQGIRRSALGPGGRDMTRLSGGSTGMWAPIVEDNRTEIAEAVRACELQLRAFREALERGDDETTSRFLATGCAWFDGEPVENGAEAPRR